VLTTIDLVLALGTKLAEILTIVLKKRATQEEKVQAQQLVQQYDWLKRTHLQIGSILRDYNEGLARGYARGDIEEAFPLCTYHGYKEAGERFAAHVRSQTSQQLLEHFELLSVSLTVETVQDLALTMSNKVSQQRAEAYVREKWLTVLGTGARVAQDVVCCYRLLLVGNQWKIDVCEVFVRS
jgi:hypothetical protein